MVVRRTKAARAPRRCSSSGETSHGAGCGFAPDSPLGGRGFEPSVSGRESGRRETLVSGPSGSGRDFFEELTAPAPLRGQIVQRLDQARE